MSDPIAAKLVELERRIKELEGKESPEYTPPTAYTPTYTGATTAGVTTYTTQVGYYMQIGLLVVAYGRLIWTNATGTGAAQISLPFAAKNVSGLRPAATIWINNFTFGGSWAEALLPEGSSNFLLYTTTTNAAITALNVEVAADITWNISYFR